MYFLPPGRYCFYRHLSVHTRSGTPFPSRNTSTGPMSFLEGTPVTGPRSLLGQYPSQVQMGGTWPGPDQGYPSQVWMGVPQPGWKGYPCQAWGTPIQWWVPPGQGWGTPLPRIGQETEYLIRGGQYALCVHAGGLSFYRMLLPH